MRLILSDALLQSKPLLYSSDLGHRGHKWCEEGEEVGSWQKKESVAGKGVRTVITEY